MRSLLGWVVAVVLVIAWLLLPRGCGPAHPPARDTVSVTNVYVYDTTPRVGHDTLVTVTRVVHEGAPPPAVDSAAVVRLYYATHVQSDTIRTDSLELTIEDSLTQNRVFDRRWSLRWLVPTLQVRTITVEVEKAPLAQLYLGLGSTLDTGGVGLPVGALLKTRREVVIQATYDPLTRRWGAGYYTKLKLK